MRVSPGIPLHWLLIVAASDTTDDCIDWRWGTDRKGYGRVVVNGRQHRAARLACARAHGVCPPGYEAAHSCGRAPCVNPRHLRWATHRENVADKMAHGTAQRGAMHPRARLTPEDVQAIRRRRAAGEWLQVLAAEYGVSETHISEIARGIRWASLPMPAL